MFYAHKCSYCSKLFYTQSESKEQAAKDLYQGIKKHLIDYGEDSSEYQFDEAPETEKNQMYYEMQEMSSAPSGGYPISVYS